MSKSNLLEAENGYPVDEIYPQKYTTILSIAGSDPSGGAGIQADLKTFSALGCYGMTVISALTAQNTKGVQGIHALPSEFVVAQLKSIFDDIDVDAIKIGMLEREEIIDQIATYLTRFNKIIVVDPVMFAKSGDQLIKDDAIEALKQKILPFATVLTPNIHEASRLTGMEKIETREEMEVAAFKLVELGPYAVIIKGSQSQLAGRDCLAVKGASKALWFETECVTTKNLHGTGCTFSAAIACFLAKGNDIVIAVRNAKDYVSQAISQGSRYQLGQGHGPVHHFYSSWSPSISFTQEAWWKVSGLYRKILDHPFIKEMGEGTLPELKFEFFIQQDYLFMRNGAKVFHVLASHTVNDEECRNYLNELGKASSKNADELFQKYNLPNFPDNQLKKGPACTGYTDFMLSTANGELTEGLVAFLPCTVSFQKIGEHLKQTGVKSNNSKYQKWIDSYSSLERRQGKVKKFICTIEKLVTAKNRFSLIKLFEQATQFEYDFWDDAYHLRK